MQLLEARQKYGRWKRRRDLDGPLAECGQGRLVAGSRPRVLEPCFAQGNNRVATTQSLGRRAGAAPAIDSRKRASPPPELPARTSWSAMWTNVHYAVALPSTVDKLRQLCIMAWNIAAKKTEAV